MLPCHVLYGVRTYHQICPAAVQVQHGKCRVRACFSEVPHTATLVYFVLQVAGFGSNPDLVVLHLVPDTPGLGSSWQGHPRNITCAGVGMGLQVFPGTTEAVQVKCEGVFAKYSVTNIGLYLQSKSFARGTEGDLAELIVILPNKGIGRAGLANGALNETFMPPERLASLMHFVLQNCYCCWSAIWGAGMKLQQWPEAVLPV